METMVRRRSATLVLTNQQKLARIATPVTKFQLFYALGGNGKITLNGIPVTLSSVQREDGSGSSFNLVVYANGERCDCYVRTKG